MPVTSGVKANSRTGAWALCNVNCVLEEVMTGRRLSRQHSLLCIPHTCGRSGIRNVNFLHTSNKLDDKLFAKGTIKVHVAVAIRFGAKINEKLQKRRQALALGLPSLLSQ